MIIIIILIIIVILIISSYENFETLSDAYDNLVTQFNNNSLIISNITSDKLTTKELVASTNGTVNNDLVVNNNLSAKNNLNVTNKITSKDANITNSLTTNNIINSNAIETNKITTQNVIFKFSNYLFNIVKVDIIIRNKPDAIDSMMMLRFDGLAIMDNDTNNRLQFINCHEVTASNYTGYTKLTVAYDTITNLSIGLKKAGESKYTLTKLDYIVGVYYSHNDVNTIYQTTYSSCHGNSSHLYRDSDNGKIFPCKGCIVQFTCAQCYSYQYI